MNYFQIASNHSSFGSSTCITQGSFQNPNILLDVIANAKATKLGVVEITGKMVSGRLLIANNVIISGCVVDGTGESGTGAVCKLLLIPFGNYVFRQAVPQDEWELQQHLDLSSDAVASFLSGPSSIGLSTHTSSVLELSFEPEDCSYTPPNDYVQSLIDAVGVASVLQERSQSSLEITARLPASQEHSADCQKLVEGFTQRQQTTDIDFRVREKRVVEKVESSVQQSKEKRSKHSDLSIYLIGIVFMIGFSIVSLMYSRSDATSTSLASKPIAASIVINSPSTDSKSEEEEPTRYSLPAQGAYNSAPPPAKSNSISQRVTFENSDGNTSAGSEVTRGSQIDDSRVVSFWVQEVKKNPNDPAAREQLAYTLLRVNRPDVSIGQFQALMRLRKVSSEELIRYTNALSLFNHRVFAGRFLRAVLAADPDNAAIREQLAQMELVSNAR